MWLCATALVETPTTIRLRLSDRSPTTHRTNRQLERLPTGVGIRCSCPSCTPADLSLGDTSWPLSGGHSWQFPFCGSSEISFRHADSDANYSGYAMSMTTTPASCQVE